MRDRPLLFLLTVLVLAPAVPLRADTEADIRADDPVALLRLRMAELQQVRRDYEVRHAEHRQQVEALTRQLHRLRSDRQSIEPALAAQIERTDAAKGEVGALDRQIAGLESHLDQVSAAAAPIASRLTEQVRAGIPHEQTQRLAAINSISEQARSDSPAARAEAVQALAAWAGDEMTLVRDRAVVNQPLLLDAGKQRVHGYHARIGLVATLFVGEDGKTIAAATGPGWTLDLSVAHRRDAARFVSVMQGQAPPALVALPLPQRQGANP